MFIKNRISIIEDTKLNFNYYSGCEVFQITLSRGYNEQSFKEDLKKLYNIIGVDGKPTVFLFTAAQVAEEGNQVYNIFSKFNFISGPV